MSKNKVKKDEIWSPGDPYALKRLRADSRLTLEQKKRIRNNYDLVCALDPVSRTYTWLLAHPEAFPKEEREALKKMPEASNITFGVGLKRKDIREKLRNNQKEWKLFARKDNNEVRVLVVTKVIETVEKLIEKVDYHNALGVKPFKTLIEGSVMRRSPYSLSLNSLIIWFALQVRATESTIKSRIIKAVRPSSHLGRVSMIDELLESKKTGDGLVVFEPYCGAAFSTDIIKLLPGMIEKVVLGDVYPEVLKSARTNVEASFEEDFAREPELRKKIDYIHSNRLGGFKTWMRANGNRKADVLFMNAPCSWSVSDDLVDYVNATFGGKPRGSYFLEDVVKELPKVLSEKGVGFASVGSHVYLPFVLNLIAAGYLPYRLDSVDSPAPYSEAIDKSRQASPWDRALLTYMANLTKKNESKYNELLKPIETALPTGVKIFTQELLSIFVPARTYFFSYSGGKKDEVIHRAIEYNVETSIFEDVEPGELKGYLIGKRRGDMYIATTSIGKNKNAIALSCESQEKAMSRLQNALIERFPDKPIDSFKILRGKVDNVKYLDSHKIHQVAFRKVNMPESIRNAALIAISKVNEDDQQILEYANQLRFQQDLK